jgi:hypothetical protein
MGFEEKPCTPVRGFFISHKNRGAQAYLRMPEKSDPNGIFFKTLGNQLQKTFDVSGIGETYMRKGVGNRRVIADHSLRGADISDWADVSSRWMDVSFLQMDVSFRWTSSTFQRMDVSFLQIDVSFLRMAERYNLSGIILSLLEGKLLKRFDASGIGVGHDSRLEALLPVMAVNFGQPAGYHLQSLEGLHLSALLSKRALPMNT